MSKLTPERATFLRKRVKQLGREMLVVLVLGITLAVIGGYAAILWERSVNPLGVGLAPAVGDFAGLLVAAPFMTAILVLRNRMNRCLAELNAKNAKK